MYRVLRCLERPGCAGKKICIVAGAHHHQENRFPHQVGVCFRECSKCEKYHGLKQVCVCASVLLNSGCVVVRVFVENRCVCVCLAVHFYCKLYVNVGMPNKLHGWSFKPVITFK